MFAQREQEELEDLYAIAQLGEGMESILKSDAYQTGLTLARARIFEEWATALSLRRREILHSDLRALERRHEAFQDIDQEGAVAREAIRREAESADTVL